MLTGGGSHRFPRLRTHTLPGLVLLFTGLLGTGLLIPGCGADEAPAPVSPPPPRPPAPAPEPPAVPTGLRIDAIGEDFIEWSWSAVAGVSGYDVQFSMHEAFTDENEILPRTTGNLSYRRDGLVAATSASLRVRSVSGTGEDRLESAWSTHVTGVTEYNENLDAVHPFLAGPADGHLVEIPVVMVTFIPLNEDNTLDLETIGSFHFADITTPEVLEAQIQATAINTKYMLEEGSRFRGYRNPAALPTLGYRVVQEFSYYEAPPKGREFPPRNPTAFLPDYAAIVERVGGREFVNERGVKEFWIFGYHTADTAILESNMSSPTTGDVSNSYQIEDLPIYDATYTIYAYNYTRLENENVHNHGHQLERILAYANEQQTGNSDLFWRNFVGRRGDGQWGTGRAGWTHMPPNTAEDYDYHNETVVESDIEDWTPPGTGSRLPVSAETWRRLPYAFPVPDSTVRVGEDGGDPAELHWYIYWMQNMPGRNNRIRHGNGYLTNWWWFTGDWDASIGSGLGLFGDNPSQECARDIAERVQFFGDSGGHGFVELTASPACVWGATAAEEWLRVDAEDAAGEGNRRIAFEVLPNSGPRRAGLVTVGGRQLIVVQDASSGPGSSCAYTLSHDDASFGPDGGVQRIELLASGRACRWEAYSTEPWVRVATGPVWRGSADLEFSVAPLPEGHAESRSGTLVLAGAEFRIVQRPDR